MGIPATSGGLSWARMDSREQERAGRASCTDTDKPTVRWRSRAVRPSKSTG